MTKTTVYLDSDLALILRQIAAHEGRSQAELVRDALTDYAKRKKRPKIPGLGEFGSGRSDNSVRVKEIMREAAEKGKLRRTGSRGAGR